MESAQSSVSFMELIDSLSRAADLPVGAARAIRSGFTFGLLQKQRKDLDNG